MISTVGTNLNFAKMQKILNLRHIYPVETYTMFQNWSKSVTFPFFFFVRNYSSLTVSNEEYNGQRSVSPQGIFVRFI